MEDKIEKLTINKLNDNVMSVYDYDKFSVQEILLKYFNVINQCVESSNQALDFMTWIKDEGLPVEVVKYLNTMVEDGTLEQIINQEIFSDLNNKIDSNTNLIEESTNDILSRVNTLVPEMPVTDFNSFQECHDYCKEHKCIMRIPAGEYILTESLTVEGVTIVGDGSEVTRIKLQNNGFLMKPYNSQKPVEIKDISFIGDSTSTPFEFCAIKFEEQTGSDRSRGYKFLNIYIEGVGCGFMITDSFRTTLKSIHMNNVAQSVHVYGQAVQTLLIDVYSNCDIDDIEISKTFKNVGMYISSSEHSGTYLRPESVRINNCSWVNHNISAEINDCLYANFYQCDLDLARSIGVNAIAYDGLLSFSGCWITSHCNDADSGIVKIGMQSTNYDRINFDNCTIIRTGGTGENMTGVLIGGTNKKGVNITNCLIKSMVSEYPLSYGIKGSSPNFIQVQGCSISAETYCVEFTAMSGGSVINNYCEGDMFMSNSTTSYTPTVTGNMHTTLTLEGGGNFNVDYVNA